MCPDWESYCDLLVREPHQWVDGEETEQESAIMPQSYYFDSNASYATLGKLFNLTGPQPPYL